MLNDDRRETHDNKRAILAGVFTTLLAVSVLRLPQFAQTNSGAAAAVAILLLSRFSLWLKSSAIRREERRDADNQI